MPGFRSQPGRVLVSRRGLVANGDPRNIATFSNIPHYFLESGAPERAPACGSHSPARGPSHEALRLERLRPLTLDRLAAGPTPGGTADGLARREVAGEVEEYISHFQLLPPRNAVREPITYYIDATLRQWFEDYGYRIGRRVRATPSPGEREAYHASRYVVAMSEWCSEDVVSTYGVAPQQVRTILPAANLDEDSFPSGGVGRRAVPAAAGPCRDRLGAKRRAASARSCLDPATHGARCRSRGAGARLEPRPRPSVREGAWLRPEGTRFPTLRWDPQKLSLRLSALSESRHPGSPR